MLPSVYIRSRKLPHFYFGFLAILFVWHHFEPFSRLVVGTVGVCATATTTTSDIKNKGYTEAREYTDLWNYITARKWDDAIERLTSNPEEASNLIVRREFGRRGGKIITKSLPIHQVFAVDVGSELGILFDEEDGSASDNENGGGHDVLLQEMIPQMGPKHVELIEMLLRVHPLGANVTDEKLRLPLHLASYSALPPPLSVLLNLIDTNREAVSTKDEDGRLPLHAATFAPISSFGLVKTLVDVYPEALRIKDKEGSLPIHLASWGGGASSGKGSSPPGDTIKIFELLLSIYPESIDVKDGDNETPLSVMFKYGRVSPEVVRYLLQRSPQSATELRDENGNTPLHGTFVVAGNTRIVKLLPLLLQTQPELAQIQNKMGQVPLHSALWQCCTSMDSIQLLLDVYAKGVTIIDETGALPLHYACREGVNDSTIVKKLLTLYPESVKHTTGDGRLPLHLALNAYLHPSRINRVQTETREGEKNGDLIHPMDDVILQLLDSFPDGAKSPDPLTKEMPLYTALRRGKPPFVIEKLVQANPAAASVTNDRNDGGTVFHLLASKTKEYDDADMETIIHMLTEAYSDGVRGIDERKRLPLHLVCDNTIAHSNSTDVLLDALLDSYSDAARVTDAEGNLPIHLACQSRNAKAIQRLIGIFPEGAAVRSSSGLLPLHIAALPSLYGGYSENDSAESNYIILKLLLDTYADAASLTNARGDLPLHTACSSPRSFPERAIFLLIKANPGAVRVTDKSGSLPIHIAVRNIRSGSPSLSAGVIRTLLESYPEGARMEDGRGNIPIQIALLYAEGGDDDDDAENNNSELSIVQMLYSAYPGSAISSDSIGRKVIHHAARIIGSMSYDKNQDWVSFAVNMIQRYPQTLEERDARGNLPLHMLCRRVGEMAERTMTTKGELSTRRSKPLEDIITLMLTTHPDGIDVEDEYGLKPMDILSDDRLLRKVGRPHTGGHNTLSENEGTISYFRKALRRGVQYWKLMKELQEITTKLKDGAENSTLDDENKSSLCDSVQSALSALGIKVSNALHDAEVEEDLLTDNGRDTNVCSLDQDNVKDNYCEPCQAERKVLYFLSRSLDVLGETLDSVRPVSETTQAKESSRYTSDEL